MRRKRWNHESDCQRMQQTSTKGVRGKANLSGKGDLLRITQEIEFWLYYQMVYAQTTIRSIQWDPQNSLEFWFTNISSNSRQKIRPIRYKQKQKKNLLSIWFCCSDRPVSEKERKQKDRRIYGPCQKTKKLVEHEGNGDAKWSWNGFPKPWKENGKN